MRHTRGFTLIELAIVLVIVGLIAGGIMVGQDMIKASKAQAVITELETIIAATQQFNQKYKALPGDMPNATEFWPQVSAGCTSEVGTNNQTCNGNGNERIAEGWAGEETERFRVWQHLALSGLYPGSFTGVAGPGGPSEMVPGINIPKSVASSGIYSLSFNSITGASNPTALANAISKFFIEDCRNCIRFGAFSAGTGNSSPAISPNDSRQIDKKVDDGNATSGIVSARIMSTIGCTTTLVKSTAQYSTSDDITCVLFIKTGL